MNTIVSRSQPPIEKMIEKTAGLSREDHLSQLRSLLDHTSETFTAMAAHVYHLDREGWGDKEDIRDHAIIKLLRRLAAGQLSAKAMELYFPQPILLNRVAGLPLADQERLASGEELLVVALKDDGSAYTMKSPFSKLPPRAVSQVLASDHIRTEEEQIVYIRFSRERQRALRHAPQPTIALDRKRKGLCFVIGNDQYFFPASDVQAQLARLLD